MGEVRNPTDTVDPVLRRIRVASAILLVAFCTVVAVITFWPGPPDPDGQDSLKKFLAQAHADGLPRWFSFGKVEFASNVLMFVPIGLFGALALTGRRWLIVPATFAGSAIIEIVQALTLPGRVGTVRDVIANGLGAIIGYLIACWVLRAVDHRAWLRTIPKVRPTQSLGAGSTTDHYPSAPTGPESRRPPATPSTRSQQDDVKVKA